MKGVILYFISGCFFMLMLWNSFRRPTAPPSELPEVSTDRQRASLEDGANAMVEFPGWAKRKDCE